MFDNDILLNMIFVLLDIYCVDVVNSDVVVVYYNIDIVLGVLYLCFEKYILKSYFVLLV